MLILFIFDGANDLGSSRLRGPVIDLQFEGLSVSFTCLQSSPAPARIHPKEGRVQMCSLFPTLPWRRCELKGSNLGAQDHNGS
ncbi:Protein of unknown function [Gryllus bimaculatus]|nr:Protein of unknown function [Gryllus bimaculatus]